MLSLAQRRVLLKGPVLVGFNELFDAASGDPATPVPYVKVKPACIGGTLAPFTCPHCEQVCPEMVHPKRSRNYHDGRGFSWCPACRKRYILDEQGAPLPEEVQVGAAHAPALVERDGKVEVLGGRAFGDGLKLLGAVT